jgi:hypothetical protein
MARATAAVGIGPPVRSLMGTYTKAGVKTDIRSFGNSPDNYLEAIGGGALFLFKDRPHPNATRVFINWLLTKDMQYGMARRPSRRRAARMCRSRPNRTRRRSRARSTSSRSARTSPPRCGGRFSSSPSCVNRENRGAYAPGWGRDGFGLRNLRPSALASAFSASRSLRVFICAKRANS